MSSFTALQLRDANGELLQSQYYDAGTDSYKPGGDPGGGGGGGGSSATYALIAPVAVAVAATDTLVIAANASRKVLIIQVNGAADVALSFGASAATLATGVMLGASDSGAGYGGGSITINHTGAVRAIGRAASSVTVTEGL